MDLFFKNSNSELIWRGIYSSWIVKFLYRAAFVINWTLLIALSVGHFGIQSLPYLFLAHAFFVILGSVLFMSLTERFGHYSMMLASLVAAIMLLLVAARAAAYNEIWLFACLLAALSIFLAQFRILFLGCVEELFSTLESERAFPLIETAETVGGILAGLLIGLLANKLMIADFLYVSVFILFFLTLILAFRDNWLHGGKLDFHYRRDKDDVGVLDEIKMLMGDKVQFNFLVSLFIIVFLGWFLFNFVEYTYTRAVYFNLDEYVLGAGSGFENVFVRDLGALFVVLNVAALLVQILLAANAMVSLGVIGALILHPIVVLLSCLGLFVNFGFFSAVLLKLNFSVTIAAAHDAYHTLFYALKSNLRSISHELAEGIIRPIGAIVGTAVIILMQFILSPSSIPFASSVIIFISSIALIITVLFLKKSYLKLAYRNVNSTDEDVAMDALQILISHHVADNDLSYISKFSTSNRSLTFRLQVLDLYPLFKDSLAILILVDFLNSEEKIIRDRCLEVLASLELSKFKGFAKNRGKLFDKLRASYERESDQFNRRDLLELMKSVNLSLAYEYSLKLLRSSKLKNVKFEILLHLSGYDSIDELPSVQKFLTAKSPELRLAAAICFRRSKVLSDVSDRIIEDYLQSGEIKKIRLAIFGLSFINRVDGKVICSSYLNADNSYLRIEAAFALLRLGEVTESLKILLNADLCLDKNHFSRLGYEFRNTAGRLSSKVVKMVRRCLIDLIDSKKAKLSEDGDLKKFDLVHLKLCYELAGEYDNAAVLINHLNSKN